jgi:hypothetical protein
MDFNLSYFDELCDVFIQIQSVAIEVFQLGQPYQSNDLTLCTEFQEYSLYEAFETQLDSMHIQSSDIACMCLTSSIHACATN